MTGDKKRLLMIAVGALFTFGVGFWVGYDYKANEVRKAFTEAFSNFGDDSGEEAAAPEAAPQFISHKQGEEITYATQTMRFNLAKSATSVSSQYGTPLVADPGTKFILIDHTVANTTDSPFMYEPYILYDKDNKQYNASDQTIGHVDNYLTVRELAPNVPETGVVMFKVPSATKEFKFGAGKGGTSEIHIVEFSVE